MKRVQLLLLLALLASSISSQTVTNIDFYLDGDEIIVTYDLDKNADIYLYVSTNEADGWNASFMNWWAYLDEAPALRAVSGDVGRSVQAGQKRKIAWNYKDELAPFFKSSEDEIANSFSVIYENTTSRQSDSLFTSVQMKVVACPPTLEPELVWYDGFDGVGNFWISKYPITVALFSEFVKETKYVTDAERKGYGEIWSTTKNEWEKKQGVTWRCDENGNPRPLPDYPKYPVVNVSWRDATKYCEWLSKKYNRSYTLPSFFDMWEVATCSVPGSGHYRGITSINTPEIEKRMGGKLDEISWNQSNSGYRIHPVGTKKPNQMHVYDMLGNCNQWCYEYVDADGELLERKFFDDGSYYVDKKGNKIKVGEYKYGTYQHAACGGSAFEKHTDFYGAAWHEDACGVNIGFRVIMYLTKGQKYK